MLVNSQLTIPQKNLFETFKVSKIATSQQTNHSKNQLIPPASTSSLKFYSETKMPMLSKEMRLQFL